MSKLIVDANLKSKGGISSFHLQFLLERAHAHADTHNWNAYIATLALCIYGIVLFPNMVDFVDVNAISIFLIRNLVPTLLGDLYHPSHTIHSKKSGIILYCAPLLMVHESPS